MLNTAKQIIEFWYEVIVTFINKSSQVRAAALSYTTLLSLVPLMTVSFTVLKAFPAFTGVEEAVQNFIFNNFVAARAEVIQEYLQQFSAQALKISAPGLLFLLVTAVLMVFNMEMAFNQIFHVDKRRKGMSAFLMYWAVITLLPVMIGMGLVITSYLTSLPVVKGTAQQFGLIRLMPFVTTFLGFTLAYAAIPNCKVALKHAMLGGAIAMLLFETAKYGFAIYILRFSAYEVLYGALAAIPIFLVWIYVSWLIALFGAVVSSVFRERGLKKDHG